MSSQSTIYKHPFRRSQLIEMLSSLIIFSIIWYMLDLYFLDNPEDVDKGIFSYFISVFIGLSLSMIYLSSIQRAVFKLSKLIRFFIALLFMIILIISIVELELEGLPWFISKCVTLSFILGVVNNRDD